MSADHRVDHQIDRSRNSIAIVILPDHDQSRDSMAEIISDSRRKIRAMSWTNEAAGDGEEVATIREDVILTFDDPKIINTTTSTRMMTSDGRRHNETLTVDEKISCLQTHRRPESP